MDLRMISYAEISFVPFSLLLLKKGTLDEFNFQAIKKAARRPPFKPLDI